MKKSNQNFLYQMERKFGKYAIPNLTMYMIGLYVVGLLLMLMSGQGIFGVLSLNVNAILHGQIWRLFTFLMIPPSTSILVIITIFFYASIGRTLEQTWGTFYYNVYIFSGIIFTILGNFIAYAIVYFTTGDTLIVGTNYYIMLSMFLAFALLYPDVTVLLMFIIPIKIKWMAYFYYAIMVYMVYQCLLFRDFGQATSIVMSLLNFFVYFYLTKKRTTVSRAQKKRKKQYQAKMVRPQGVTRHRCAVCGATEESDSTLEFRFCSKCKGNYEYCQNHLFTHEHVK